MEEMSTEKNQQASNLMSVSNEQLEQLSFGDKADKISCSLGKTSDKFSFGSDSINAMAEEEEEVPVRRTESDPMEVPKNTKPRQRRVSDVIDSFGDCVPDVNGTKTVSSPDRITSTHVLDSPVSSGYGSIDGGTPKSTMLPDSDINQSSPKVLKVPQMEVTDSAVSAVDALPMSDNEDMSSR